MGINTHIIQVQGDESLQQLGRVGGVLVGNHQGTVP